MQNDFFQTIDVFLRSASERVTGRNLKKLIKNQSKVIQTDILCLSKQQQESVLSQTGLSLKDLEPERLSAESISKLWSIELLIIENLEFPDLIARLWLVRQKFRSQVGDDLYKHYLSTLPDKLTDDKIKEIQTAKPDDKEQLQLKNAVCGDIVNLTRQIQRLNYYKLLRLDGIYQAKITILNVFAVVLFVMAVVLYQLYNLNACCGFQAQYFTLPILTIFSGMIGSCMSLLQRTEKASNAPSSFTDSVLDAMDINLSMSLRYVWSLALSGAIFAALLYLLAVSDFVSLGEFFPKLAIANDGDAPAFCQKPKGISAIFGCIEFNQSNALMLVWGFMAGFAERLVPDTLDSLMEKAKKPKT